jgi:hypothetical protein
MADAEHVVAAGTRRSQARTRVIFFLVVFPGEELLMKLARFTTEHENLFSWEVVWRP